MRLSLLFSSPRQALVASVAALASALPTLAAAAEAPDPKALITDKVIAEARAILDSAIVSRSVKAQNAKYGALSQAEIDALDQQWRAERKADDKPLISTTLSNPASSYLTRRQANALGLYAAIFVMDRNGLNVGQSAITGDFWQGDEAKFAKTFMNPAADIFIDEPEWVDEFSVWIAQLNVTIKDEQGAPIGAATFDINLHELERRAALAERN